MKRPGGGYQPDRNGSGSINPPKSGSGVTAKHGLIPQKVLDAIVKYDPDFVHIGPTAFGEGTYYLVNRRDVPPTATLRHASGEMYRGNKPIRHGADRFCRDRVGRTHCGKPLIAEIRWDCGAWQADKCSVCGNRWWFDPPKDPNEIPVGTQRSIEDSDRGRWTVCSVCDGFALVGNEGTACQCARYGLHPGLMMKRKGRE